MNKQKFIKCSIIIVDKFVYNPVLILKFNKYHLLTMLKGSKFINKSIIFNCIIISYSFPILY